MEMQAFNAQLNICADTIQAIASNIESGVPCEKIDYSDLYAALYKLMPLFPRSLALYQTRLRDRILPNIKLQNTVQYNQFGPPIIIPNNGINPIVFGQVIATIRYIQAHVASNNDVGFWSEIHPEIIKSSRELFENSRYPEAVEAAFLEITIRVKAIIRDKTGVEVDGTSAMEKAFSANNPIISLGDISTQTGRDIQRGYMELFAGSVRCIRNPRAHERVVVDKADAIRKLHLASLLMSAIDNAAI